MAIVFGRLALGNGLMFDAVPTMGVWSRYAGDEIHWKSIISMEGEHRSHKSGGSFSRDDIEERSRRAWRLMSGWTTMLMSQDIEQQIFEPPEKLNKQRVKKGRPPIGERRIIRIKHATLQRIGVNGEMGERSSPRMHWRRGHFRNLGDGRIIPVAPTIVNAIEGAKPLAKSYVFG